MPMDRSKYPTTWEGISYEVRFLRAAGHCEGSPVYPDCRARHGEPHPVTGSKVVLTVVHLNHDTWNNKWSNLRAMCQRCHLTHDAKEHAAHASETRRKRQIEAGQTQLWREHAEK